MKKIIIIITFLFISLSFSFALTLQDIKVKIVVTIAHALVKSKNVKVDLNDKNFLYGINGKKGDVVFVKNCKKADIIITDSIKYIQKNCRNKLIFVTNYRAYKTTPNAVGALFWQKGRPVIIFNKKVIRKKHINLPDQFKQYED